MDFLESPRFPLVIAKDSDGGPLFSTDRVILRSGREQANINWPEASYKFNAATGVRSVKDLVALIDFFWVVAGSAIRFRFKDWSDYRSCDIVDANAKDQLPGPFDQVICADATAGQATVQLIKTYGGAGYLSSTGTAMSRVRTIYKPVTGTVRIAVNDVEIMAGWTCDYTTGILTFNPGLNLHDKVSAGYEFDIPARFDSDELDRKFDSYRLGSAQVPIVGVRP